MAKTEPSLRKRSSLLPDLGEYIPLNTKGATAPGTVALNTTEKVAATNWRPRDKGTSQKKAYKVLGATSVLDDVTSTHDRVLLSVISVLAILTRFWKLHEPEEVVFDEVHFGKFASYYLRRTYYFDVHPPLAKLMLAGLGLFLGYDGHYDFGKIGGNYLKENVPYVGLRSLPAALGAFTVPFVYLIMRHSGYCKATACVAAFFVLFDNALIAQSRLILLDSMLMFFMVVCMYCWVRFYKLRNREFTQEWWWWLIATGVSMSMTTSVKLVGLFLIMAIGIATIADLWRLLDIRKGLTMHHIKRHIWARALALIFVPIVVYLFWFWVHFTVLTYSGPGDAFMSSAFQKTLEGNPLVAMALDIHYGDNITIKHKDTNAFLHSHLERYPLRYDDGRVSSAGQQVTGYPHQDANNIWRIETVEGLNKDELAGPPKRKYIDGEVVVDKRRVVKHKDIVRLLHVQSNSYLLTHDVASPTMPTNQEFTTWSKADGKMKKFNDTLFTAEIDDGKEGQHLQSSSDYLRFIHVPSRVALWTHSKALPEWAFKQQEVNGNRNIKDSSTRWFVNEIIGINATKLSQINNKKKEKTPSVSFFSKFWELQSLMISHNAGLVKPHPYSSHPATWPFLVRGISFWTQADSRRQIYLLGNPFGWWAAASATAGMVFVALADVISRRRGLELFDSVAYRNRLYMSGGFLLLTWATHYFPFFLMGRMLFLHHYLPALIVDYMFAAVFFQYVFVNDFEFPVSPAPLKSTVLVHRCRSGRIAIVAAVVLITLQAASFAFFAPTTYSTPGLDVSAVLNRKWLPSWDFHFAK